VSVSSSWFVGAVTLDAAVTIVVDTVNDAVIAAGTYYLYDDTDALSLLDVILAAVAPFMTDEAIYIGQDRKIRVTASVAFAWTTIPSELQAILGLGASFTSTTSETASAVSTLLWSPAYCATPVGHPAGVSGYSERQRVVTESPSGLTIRTTTNGTAKTRTKLLVHYVIRERAWADGVDGGSPGDLRRFWLDVLEVGARWKHYPEVTEDDAVATAVSWTTPFGPYKSTQLRPDWWSRPISATDAFSDVELAGTLTAEIT